MKSILFLGGTALVVIFIAIVSVSSGYKNSEIHNQATTIIPLSPGFNEYWYQGEAEISSYKLEQSRYGEIHPGHAVLVFVTEDFSKNKQVKSDNPGSSPEDIKKILKLNLVKKFTTGVYDYSMMSSIFTPVDGSKSLKLTTSAQEWCGHAFSQFNLKDNFYEVKEYSYFESEGDRSYQLNSHLLEDEIWNMIRISPEKLPKGQIEVIPGTMYARLAHIQAAVYQAKASISNSEANPKIKEYTLFYPDLKRELSIQFEGEFPHKIISWSESYPAPAWNKQGNILTTKAILQKSIKSAYWRANNLQDSSLRAKLGLQDLNLQN